VIVYTLITAYHEKKFVSLSMYDHHIIRTIHAKCLMLCGEVWNEKMDNRQQQTPSACNSSHGL